MTLVRCNNPNFDPSPLALVDRSVLWPPDRTAPLYVSYPICPAILAFQIDCNPLPLRDHRQVTRHTKNAPSSPRHDRSATGAVQLPQSSCHEVDLVLLGLLGHSLAVRRPGTFTHTQAASLRLRVPGPCNCVPDLLEGPGGSSTAVRRGGGTPCRQAARLRQDCCPAAYRQILRLLHRHCTITSHG